MLSVGAKITFPFRTKKEASHPTLNGATAPKRRLRNFFNKNSTPPIKHVIYYRTYTMLIRYAPLRYFLKSKAINRYVL